MEHSSLPSNISRDERGAAASQTGPATNATHDRPAKEQFGAPRRFGIGTLLIMTAATSLLLALLVALGAPAPVMMLIVAFVALVAVGQAVLYQGKDPRLASIVSGSVIALVFAIALIMMQGVFGQNLQSADRDMYVCSLVALIIVGPALGYLGGGVVAGVFLLMDRWERKFGRGRREPEELFDPFGAPGSDGSVRLDTAGRRSGGADDTHVA